MVCGACTCQRWPWRAGTKGVCGALFRTSSDTTVYSGKFSPGVKFCQFLQSVQAARIKPVNVFC